jgi:WD40 repeat protein
LIFFAGVDVVVINLFLATDMLLRISMLIMITLRSRQCQFYNLFSTTPAAAAVLIVFTFFVILIDLFTSSPPGQKDTRSNCGTVILWDVHSHQPIANLEGHKYTVTSVAFDPNGKYMASGWISCMVYDV